MEITYIYCKSFARGLYGINIQSKCGHEFRKQVSKQELNKQGLIDVLGSHMHNLEERLVHGKNVQDQKDAEILWDAMQVLINRQQRESGM